MKKEEGLKKGSLKAWERGESWWKKETTNLIVHTKMYVCSLSKNEILTTGPKYLLLNEKYVRHQDKKV